MDGTNMDGTTSEQQPTFEESLAELEAAVRDLEEGQLGLSASLTRYEQSVKHLNRCNQLLAAAEQKIELLTGVADDGSPLTEPFSDAAPQAAPAPGQRRKQRRRPAPGPADENGCDETT